MFEEEHEIHVPLFVYVKPSNLFKYNLQTKVLHYAKSTYLH